MAHVYVDIQTLFGDHFARHIGLLVIEGGNREPNVGRFTLDVGGCFQKIRQISSHFASSRARQDRDQAAFMLTLSIGWQIRASFLSVSRRSARRYR